MSWHMIIVTIMSDESTLRDYTTLMDLAINVTDRLPYVSNANMHPTASQTLVDQAA